MPPEGGGMTGDSRQTFPSDTMNQPRSPMPSVDGYIRPEGGMMGGDQGGNRMPTREDDENRRMQDEKMSNDRFLSDMKRSASQMEREIKRFTSRIATLEKKGISASAEAKKALAQANSMIEAIKIAGSPEKMREIPMEEFGDIMQTLNEEMQKMEMATQIPKMIKEAQRQITKFKTALKRAEKQMPKMKINVSSLVSEWRDIIEGMERSVVSANELLAGSDPEGAADMLRDEVFERMQEAGDKQMIFEMVSNMSKMTKNASLEITAMRKKVSALKKQGKDVAELEEVLNDSAAKVKEVTAMISSKFDPDELFALIEELEGLKDSFDEKWGEITGELPDEGPSIPGLEGFKPMQMPGEMNMYIRNEYDSNPPMNQPKGGSGEQVRQSQSYGGASLMAAVHSAFVPILEAFGF